MRTDKCVCGNAMTYVKGGWIHAGLFHGPCRKAEPPSLFNTVGAEDFTRIWRDVARVARAMRDNERGIQS